MPVNSKSIFYNARIYTWKTIADILEGEEQIKSKGELYLPRLKGQKDAGYESYLNRGSFFNATARTIQGLGGAIMRKSVVTEIPKAMELWLDKVTLDGLSFKDVANVVVDELLSYGYYGILVDIKNKIEMEPYLSLYNCINIFNVKYDYVDGDLKLIRLVLGESDYIDSSEDEFIQQEVEKVKLLELDEAGFLEVSTWRKIEGKRLAQGIEWELEGEVLKPNIRGKRFDFIPFQFFGSVANLPVPPKPPLLDLVWQNLQHWRLDVDYHHGLHFCALPTPWAAGFKKDAKLYIGPEKAWISENPEARCGYLEFTGEGLRAIKEALENTEKRMAVLSSRLLEGQKIAVEAAETHRIRASGDSATLGSIANSVELGLSRVLRIVAEWMNQDPDAIIVTMNKDFVNQKLSGQEITSLLAAVQAGRISMDTFLYNLKTGEILPEDRSVDEEKEMIEAEGFEPFKEEEEIEEEDEDEEIEE